MATKNGRQHGVVWKLAPLAWLFGIDAGVRVAFSLMASHQLVPTTTSARPTPEASAQTPTTKAPTHSLKVYMY